VLVELERDGQEIEALAGDEARAISVVTVSELLQGVHRARGTRRTRRAAAVEQILATFEAIPITEQVARVHAEVWARLLARGESVPAHDLWVGATALAHGFGVATLDAGHFARLPGLRVVTP
jgi:predicted nucleic acid-binding protein